VAHVFGNRGAGIWDRARGEGPRAVAAY
jgi:hypothetical protein